ncbi:carboxymuconolactone decarboxylase family protein [Natrinema versiforme]|uniref:Carboxymuconolactone decarboxylase family protein n=1 Tax=Natrinema versiforme TaxID=88724 RepID=A0A4V1FZN9_9EURY|nr:carboxymuconolactone decarboxylase family protein [Natrinema versiforme]QCS42506.1 carboxymuconolactone decarboxylase family protein [Natrinema versiforme]
MSDQSSRIPTVSRRSQVPEDQHEQYDRIADTRETVSGPFPVLLNSPELAGRVGHLGTYVRFESSPSGRERELAILTTAREFDCAYEWAFHEPVARREGVPANAIEAVAREESLDKLADTDALVVRYGRELLREHAVSETTFQRAAAHFGSQGITDLTATIGYYSMLACVLNAFEVQPEDEPPFSS